MIIETKFHIRLPPFRRVLQRTLCLLELHAQNSSNTSDRVALRAQSSQGELITRILLRMARTECISVRNPRASGKSEETNHIATCPRRGQRKGDQRPRVSRFSIISVNWSSRRRDLRTVLILPLPSEQISGGPAAANLARVTRSIPSLESIALDRIARCSPPRISSSARANERRILVNGKICP